MKAYVPQAECTIEFRDKVLEVAKTEHLTPAAFIRKVLRKYIDEKKNTKLHFECGDFGGTQEIC